MRFRLGFKGKGVKLKKENEQDACKLISVENGIFFRCFNQITLKLYPD